MAILQLSLGTFGFLVLVYIYVKWMVIRHIGFLVLVYIYVKWMVIGRRHFTWKWMPLGLICFCLHSEFNFCLLPVSFLFLAFGFCTSCLHTDQNTRVPCVLMSARSYFQASCGPRSSTSCHNLVQGASTENDMTQCVTSYKYSIPYDRDNQHTNESTNGAKFGAVGESDVGRTSG